VLYNVDAGQRAVIFDRFKGVMPEVVGEGTHVLIPWVQRAFLFDIRTRPREIATTTGSKDLQMVNITLRVLYRPNAETLPQIYQTYNFDYEERIMPSIANEVLKATVAQFNAEELITRREHVSASIAGQLRARAREFGIMLDDVSIKHLAFGREFTQAVESKQVAQQEAEKSRFVVLKAEQEKRAAIIRAEGEATAAKLINDALVKGGPGLVALRKIEASREIADTLAHGRNVTYLPGGGSGNGSGTSILLPVQP
jgi:prohibitin 1